MKNYVPIIDSQNYELAIPRNEILPSKMVQQRSEQRLFQVFQFSYSSYGNVWRCECSDRQTA